MLTTVHDQISSTYTAYLQSNKPACCASLDFSEAGSYTRPAILICIKFRFLSIRINMLRTNQTARTVLGHVFLKMEKGDTS